MTDLMNDSINQVDVLILNLEIIKADLRKEFVKYTQRENRTVVTMTSTQDNVKPHTAKDQGRVRRAGWC
ncbi:hypothetical protein KIN20_011684 [Parelaphostrongylus tenuis]|uniref:Uncharacterized protein n=1 Tax=Parelaphostrongylus tenuis TaxID=148309 RepID=A0AAD5QM97_PARTN|nr:hypothetical protein KIN20_011684 [Parelaphostrongylus tenuis]